MNSVKMTENFLKQISHHLSGRAKYSNTQFEVIIQYDRVTCFPSVEVFPDTHKRQKSDKNCVLYHVLKYHFSDLILENDTLDTSLDCRIKPGYLVPGYYKYLFKYTSYGKRKRRSWTVVESLNNENNKGDDVNEA